MVMLMPAETVDYAVQEANVSQSKAGVWPMALQEERDMDEHLRRKHMAMFMPARGGDQQCMQCEQALFDLIRQKCDT
jgi:hypothetical protein